MRMIAINKRWDMRMSTSSCYLAIRFGSGSFGLAALRVQPFEQYLTSGYKKPDFTSGFLFEKAIGWQAALMFAVGL